MEAKSLSEENKTHNQMINSSPRSEFLGKLVISSGVRGVGSWMKWLFSDGVLPNATVILPQCFSLISFDPPLLEALLHYIVLLYSIPPSTCLLSNFVFEFLSPFPQPFDFLGVKVVENTVQRSSPH